MKLKKTIVSGVCAALLLAGAALAQMHDHHGHAGMAGAAGMDKMMEHLATALNLTDAQKAQAKQIHEQVNTKMTPLLAQSRQQHQELEALLNGVNPDPTEIGRKAIAAHATRAQIKAIHEDAMTRFSAILTPAQKTKLDQMHQMHHPDGAPEDAPPAD
jgi:Spy/CpxP family protein refolding chaperone